jgi:transcription-repair coupling factor (superfamily II helicase)
MLMRNGEYVQIGGKFPRLNAQDPGERLREVLKLVRAF